MATLTDILKLRSTFTGAEIKDLYEDEPDTNVFTDTEKNKLGQIDSSIVNNTNVSANIAARHAAVTVTDSAEIDFTLTGQNITASLKTGSIDETKLDASVNASLDLADTAVQPEDLNSILSRLDALEGE
jgi:hypothetical protein